LKKAVCLGCWITVMFMLFGCGGIELTKDHLTLSTKLANVEKACHESLKPDYSKIKDENKIALLELSRNNNRTLLTAIGREPCKQKNFYEATVEVAQSQNRVIEKTAETAGNFGLAFLGADVMKTALQEAGDSYKASEWASIRAEKDSGNTNWSDSGNTAWEDSGNVFNTSPIDSNISTSE